MTGNQKFSALILKFLLSSSVALANDVEDERLLKIGTMSALAYNQEALDSTLSEMGNSAVREPIGSMEMTYRHQKSNTYTSGNTTHYGVKITQDSFFTGLILPIGDEYGLSLHGNRFGATVKNDNPSSTISGLSPVGSIHANLFWRNPKDGSYDIGVGYSNFSESEDFLSLGYSYLDPSKGRWGISSKNTWTNGEHSSTELICGTLYWPQFVLSGKSYLDGDSTSLRAKYEHDRYSLSVSRSIWEDYDRVSGGLSFFTSDNFMLSAGYNSHNS